MGSCPPPTYYITDLGPGAATAINSAGQVAGYTGSPQAYLWSPGTMTTLGNTLGGSYSQALALNDNGQAAGQADATDGNYHAFLYNGSMSDLGSLGAYPTTAYGINVAGQVVGASNYEAFLYDGTMHNLGTLGGNDSAARGINASGTMYDLNTLVANLGDWSLSEAEGVNDAGSIVGYGTIGGVQHGFLLTPTPEPSTLLLLVVGMAGVLAHAWRRRVR